MPQEAASIASIGIKLLLSQPMIQTSLNHSFFVSLLLVATQVVTSSFLVLSAQFSFAHIIALSTAAIGLLLGMWALLAMQLRRLSVMPELKQNTELVTSGPYRWVRHPMYSALLLFTGGFACSPFTLWKLATWFLLLGVLLAKIVREERYLKQRFNAYYAYAERTKRIIPFLF